MTSRRKTRRSLSLRTFALIPPFRMMRKTEASVVAEDDSFSSPAAATTTAMAQQRLLTNEGFNYSGPPLQSDGDSSTDDGTDGGFAAAGGRRRRNGGLGLWRRGITAAGQQPLCTSSPNLTFLDTSVMDRMTNKAASAFRGLNSRVFFVEQQHGVWRCVNEADAAAATAVNGFGPINHRYGPWGRGERQRAVSYQNISPAGDIWEAAPAGEEGRAATVAAGEAADTRSSAGESVASQPLSGNWETKSNRYILHTTRYIRII